MSLNSRLESNKEEEEWTGSDVVGLDFGDDKAVVGLDFGDRVFGERGRLRCRARFR